MKKLVLVILVTAGCGKAGAPGAPSAAPAAPESIDMQAFGAFEYVPKMQLPADILKHDKHLVRARGFMNPGRSMRDIPAFELVKDRASCCFGRSPKMNHFFQVTMREGVKTNFTSDPVTVVGKLIVEDRWDGDWQMGLYYVEDAVIEN